MTESPCKELEARPIMRKNMPGGGSPKTPVSRTIVPSSGVITWVEEEQRSSPALPAVALQRPVLGVGCEDRTGFEGPVGVHRGPM